MANADPSQSSVSIVQCDGQLSRDDTVMARRGTILGVTL
jgi:hypothetical protein